MEAFNLFIIGWVIILETLHNFCEKACKMSKIVYNILEHGGTKQWKL